MDTELFYSVRDKVKVAVPAANVRKVQYPNGRYGLTATHEGQKLCKFVGATAFNAATYEVAPYVPKVA